MGLKLVNEVDCRLRRAEVMLLDRLFLAAAVTARVLLRLEVEVARADGGFEVPVLRQQPRVAVAQPGPDAPALVAFVLRPQDLDIRDVVKQVRDVQADEVLVEGLAEPVAGFGMQAQVLQLLAVAAVVFLPVEGVHPGFQLQAPFPRKADFRSDVRGRCPPIRDVRLDPPSAAFAFRQACLGMCARNGKRQH